MPPVKQVLSAEILTPALRKKEYGQFVRTPIIFSDQTLIIGAGEFLY